MAGAILPPELLGRIVACHIEDKLESLYDDEEEESEPEQAFFVPVLSPTEARIWEHLRNQEALLRERKPRRGYGEARDDDDESGDREPGLAFSSGIHMPGVTLDQLTLVPPRGEHRRGGWECRLECALPEWNERTVVTVRPDLLVSLAYNYDPESSPLFTCIALALRYKAPIVLEQPPSSEPGGGGLWSSEDDLDREFPQRATLGSLVEQSTRVTENIERGFEIHKLSGALQIAVRLGDREAAEQIRARLDEYDSMDDLPTTAGTEEGEDGADTARETDPGEHHYFDDLDENILQ
mmetsp:Transcript_107045/g.218361  ORF Transcript_107045/g.218361 Transcript_107045/m.218361 type:complete len:295 (+) Transcript_107045:365-1249(+)